MLVFRNPGLIDLEVVRNLGVSVKLPGSFGRFGTGLKFAIASILRGGGKITIYRGEEEHILGTETKTIRGTEHQIITLDGVGIGIAVTFGRDWEPWMVLRELGCNALDEHGEFWQTEAAANSVLSLPPDTTTIVVDWEDLDGAYEQRSELFLDGKSALWESEKLRILSGPSAHIFYRGVRVYKTEKPSRFTYDLLAEQALTEDRTLASSWAADRLIREAWLSIEDKALLTTLLGTGSGYDESKIDLLDSTRKPSKILVDAAVDLMDRGQLQNESAKKIVQRARRSKLETSSGYGSYTRVIEDGLSYAQEQLGALGVKFEPTQKIVVLEEFPDRPDDLSFVEDGRIYILEDLTKKPAREVMTELLHRWVELNGGPFYAASLLIPLLVNKSVDLKMDEQLVAEDAAIAEMEAKREELEAVPAWKRKSGERFIPEEPYTWVVEGTWTRNDKVVHREAATEERAQLLNEQRFHWTDGTQLHLTSRKLAPGESIVNKPGYTELIDSAVRTGIWSHAEKKEVSDDVPL